MNAEPVGTGQESSESKPQNVSAEQARQILGSRPDALQSYLVSTTPSGWSRPTVFGPGIIFGIYLLMSMTEWALHFRKLGTRVTRCFVFSSDSRSLCSY